MATIVIVGVYRRSGEACTTHQDGRRETLARCPFRLLICWLVALVASTTPGKWRPVLVQGGDSGGSIRGNHGEQPCFRRRAIDPQAIYVRCDGDLRPCPGRVSRRVRRLWPSWLTTPTHHEAHSCIGSYWTCPWKLQTWVRVRCLLARSRRRIRQLVPRILRRVHLAAPTITGSRSVRYPSRPGFKMALNSTRRCRLSSRSQQRTAGWSVHTHAPVDDSEPPVFSGRCRAWRTTAEPRPMPTPQPCPAPQAPSAWTWTAASRRPGNSERGIGDESGTADRASMPQRW